METHRARGIVLELTGNYNEAAAEFEAAIAINPNIADLHLALGRSYRFLEQYDKAIEEFNKANALNPTDSEPDTYISRTYSTVGEYAKAIQYAQQAVKDDPLDPYLYGNLGQMYSRNAQYQESIEPLRISIRGGVSDDGREITGIPLDYGRVAEYYSSYGLSLARTGQCGEALQISQSLFEGVPNDETAAFNAGEIVNICQQFSEDGDQIIVTDTPEGSEEE
jgi:tetratricopeptide (TPR) repeat protein